MQRRGFVLAFVAALCACAPAPVRMPAARASEVLNLFAAGRGPADLCSAEGRAMLRGAVRAYGEEMRVSGLTWPALPGAEGSENVTQVDVSVLIAFAAGFVRTSDFQQPLRGKLALFTIAGLPDVISLRRAARVACADIKTLQQAAARVLIETDRMADMVASARRRGGAEAVERLVRQSERVERAQEDMREAAAVVEALIEAHRL
jgi:hypothetical protein